ncbi:uncharacterized protein PAN0_008d3421 [Moesziomyces antarcticus]|uniref:Uncharacterized protein n=2 Tax=Pseudozyma antarctica TaxID=84753 RepID=A0A5C3FQX2_PSEA2|nr:uncharacterized protein PAN0_008d3421 [Moesziomyces antarcticus]GAK65204.1 hypothetical protein PAN0_008d3421 [Moesziomyces antarcticus]SPO46205.1 uncharacterized protein PSANT_03891 [Moesziomyces antarcticus]
MASNLPQNPAPPLTVQYTIPAQPHPFEITVTKTPLSLDGETRLLDQQVTRTTIVRLQRQQIIVTTALGGPPTVPRQESVVFRTRHGVEPRNLEAFAAAAVASPHVVAVHRGTKPRSGANTITVIVTFQAPPLFVDAALESARQLPGFLFSFGAPPEGDAIMRAMQSMTL